MSWILKHKRKLVAFVIMLLAIVFVVTPLWPLSLFMLLLPFVFLFIDRKVPVCSAEVMSMLHGRQQIKKIDTLIIGDVCSEKSISQYIRGNVIAIQHPDRGLESSYQIFMHLESLLEENGTLIIVNDLKNNQNAYTLFDMPYLYWVSKMELGIGYLDAAVHHPLYHDPLRSIKILLHINKGHYKAAICPKLEFVQFCTERNLELVYLER